VLEGEVEEEFLEGGMHRCDERPTPLPHGADRIEATKFEPVINLNVAQACLSSRSPCAGCGIGSCDVPYPSLINYVTGTGPTDVASATGGC
jgi:hypothetical protein